MLRLLAKRALYQSTSIPFSFPRTASEKWLDLSALRRFLVDHRVNVVIDVGANEGQFVTKIRGLGYEGHIISFEPDHRAYRTLYQTHRSDPRWKGFDVGLSDTAGTARFALAKHSVLSSFLPLVHHENVDSHVDVQIATLDDYSRTSLWGALQQQAPIRVLLKTDTQGYDLHVLRGALKTLPHVVGILAELSVVPIYTGAPTFDESVKAYRDVGFDIQELSIVNRTPDGRVLEFDGLFVRRPEELP